MVSTITYTHIALPEVGMSSSPPEIPAAVYERRLADTYRNAASDWVVVYGDREHYANLAYVTGFDPRFEEALLLLGPQGRRVLAVGNEGLGYTGMVRIPTDVVLCQSLSLLGQDRGRAPRIMDVLRTAGIRRGQTVGVIGWKYLEQDEGDGDVPLIFAPAVIVDLLRQLVGATDLVTDATAVLMHPTTGLRARNEAVQIAAFEWSAARATANVLRIVRNTRAGLTELEAVSTMGYGGDPLSCHVMFASGTDDLIGLRSPTSRHLSRGDGVSTAVGFWGGLCCRAGLLADKDDEFVQSVARPYFAGLVTWYETMRIGTTGGVIFDAVSEALAVGGLRPLLNPGHLTGLDEWVNSSVRPASDGQIESGMAFQCDIIPTPMQPGWAMNCEDPVVVADETLRNEIKDEFPDVWVRIRGRQDFMRNALGIGLAEEILPLSTMPAYLPPLWLSPDSVLCVAG